MGYKTTDEMLKSFKDLIHYFGDKKNEFPVHKDYLIDNMTEKEFNNGYEEYRKLMVSLQEDMCVKPDEYGLFAYDKSNKPKPAYHNNYPYLWIFLALSFSGEIKNDVLYVSYDKFNEYANGKLIGSHSGVPKNIDKLISQLSKFGFTVTGYNKEQNSDFSVSSDIPRLISVIKASTISQYAFKSTMSDYVTFNEKLYAIGKKDQIPFENTYTYSIMPEVKKVFSSALVSGLAETGWNSYIERHHGPAQGRLTYPTLEYYYNATDATWNAEYGDSWIFIRVDVNRLLNQLDYFDNMPERYRDLWIKSLKCRGCRKGDCSTRRVETIFGKRMVCCNTAKIVYNCNIEDIPHIIEVTRLMAKK